MTPQRIVVVGTTGSGKSTLAAQIAQQLNIPHIELDALYWGPGWSERPYEELRPLVDKATDKAAWVVDGNYTRVRDIVWPKADTLVWLDYHLLVIFWRLWWRTMRRVFMKERLWNDNRERFSDQFLSRDSLFLWAIKKQPVYRREYPQLIALPEYSHLSVIHMSSPRDTEKWLQGLGGEQAAAGELPDVRNSCKSSRE